MLKWKIKEGLISELFLDDQVNCILPWGAETADEWAFFSLEKNVGYRYQRLNERLEWDEKVNQGTMECLMRQGHFRLDFKDELFENELLRDLRLETLVPTMLMDFVLRFRFKKEFFPEAQIASHHYRHENSNIYHQFATDEAHLVGPSGKLVIKIDEAFCSEAFKPHLYVRDRGDEWIIHARMLPQKYDRLCIKLCNSFFKTSPLPHFLSQFLLKFPSLKKSLWYRGERAPFSNRFLRWLNPNAFPFCTLSQGEKLSWKVRMIWNKT